MLSAKARTCLMKGTWVWVWVHLFQVSQGHISSNHTVPSPGKCRKNEPTGWYDSDFLMLPPNKPPCKPRPCVQKNMPFVSFQGAVAHSANHQARTASVVEKSWRMHGFLSKSPEKLWERDCLVQFVRSHRKCT